MIEDSMVLAFLISTAVLAQAPDLYTVRAVISDAKGAPVRDLAASDVSLQQGGVAIALEKFEKDERPMQVALLIDSSEPVANHYRLQLVDAARSFLASLPTSARVTVWTTGDRPTRI